MFAAVSTHSAEFNQLSFDMVTENVQSLDIVYVPGPLEDRDCPSVMSHESNVSEPQATATVAISST
jgi:hypothetical protein